MSYSDLFPKPIVLPWVKGRELSGLSWLSYSFTPKKEIYKSWIHALSFANASGTITKVKDGILAVLKNGRWIMNEDGFFLSSSEPFSISFRASGYTGFSNSTTYKAILYNQGDYRVKAPNTYTTTTGTAEATVIQTGGGGTNVISASASLGNMGRVIDWDESALSGVITRVYAGGQWCYLPANYTTSSVANQEKIYKALHLKGSGSSTYLLALALTSQRPLASSPVLVSECSATELVTLGGRSVRTQHSHRRIWEVEMLLDGFVDVRNKLGNGLGGGTDDTYRNDSTPINVVDMYDMFLDAASNGVSLYIDRDLVGCRFTRRAAQAFGGIPNEICGKLVGATSLRFSAQNGLSRRYPVTLQIAEEDPYL